MPVDPNPLFAYVGNWDIQKKPPKDAYGICTVDPATGDLTVVESVYPGICVGVTCVDEDRKVLYCVDETPTNLELFNPEDVVEHAPYMHGGGGRVFAFRVDPQSGSLEEINHLPSFGSLPSYVTLDHTGEYLLVTHHTGQAPITTTVKDDDGQYRIDLRYDDATTVLFPVSAEGAILAPCDIYTHRAEAGLLGRQTHSQLHSVIPAPSADFFVVCDKGSDEVFTLTIDRVERRLRVVDTHRPLPGGSPRYCAFHPTQPYLYVNFETRAMVGVFTYSEGGTLTPQGMISALPPDVSDHLDIKQSDLCVHPSGSSLYTLLRGLDAVSVFTVGSDGGLDLVQTLHLPGIGPRGAAFGPDGRFLYVAMVSSDEVLVLAVEDDGTLRDTGTSVTFPRAGSVAFFSAGIGPVA